MEDHGGQDKTDAFRASVQSPGQAPRLPREVKVQIQAEQMVEDVTRHSTNGLLRDIDEDSIAQFLKSRSPYPCDTIYLYGYSSAPYLDLEAQLTGYDHGSGNGPRSPTDSREINVHGIDDALEVERNLDIEYLSRFSCWTYGASGDEIPLWPQSRDSRTIRP